VIAARTPLVRDPNQNDRLTAIITKIDLLVYLGRAA
jgi:hypothetical protein